MIIMDDADINLALRAAVFAAVGTAGERCTSLRRILLHENIYDDYVEKIKKAYSTIKIGNPLDTSTLMGPLHTKAAVKEYTDGLEAIKAQGGKIIYGGNVIEGEGNYVEPTIVEINWDAEIVKTELFVPIVYIIKFKTIDEGIMINNSVP